MDTLLTVAEVATTLRLKPGTVYSLVAARKLRHSRVGLGRGRIVIPADAIEEYLAGTTVGAEEAERPPKTAAAPNRRPAFKHIRVN